MLEHTADFGAFVEAVTGRKCAPAALEKALKQVLSPTQTNGVVTKSPGPHKFASTQFNLEGTLRDKVLDLAEMVEDEDLAGEGRETEPHVTIKYGLHDSDPGAIRELIEDFGPVTVALGKVGVFTANADAAQRGGPEFDVVYVEVLSKALRELNSILCQLPHTDTHSTYTPHITLAYVKPGAGAKYKGWTQLEGQQAEFKEVIYSSPEGLRTAIDIASYAWQEQQRDEPLHPPVLAVDLDGTILEYEEWQGPDVFGRPREGAAEALTRLREQGYKILIWTTRGNIEGIKQTLEEHKIPYDWINRNPYQPVGASAKVAAAFYIDDRGIDGKQDWQAIYEQVVKSTIDPNSPAVVEAISQTSVHNASTQPATYAVDYNTLRALAEVSTGLFRELLSPLNCENVDLKRVTPDTLREALSPPGLIVIYVPIKGEKRATEKVNEDYGGDWTQLKDILRATVAADNERQLRAAIKLLEDSGAIYARPPKDRLSEPLENGYRDFLANYILPNGLIVEVQYQLKGPLVARQEDADRYHLMRSRSDLTQQERRDVDEQGRGRQDAEWREAQESRKSGISAEEKMGV